MSSKVPHTIITDDVANYYSILIVCIHLSEMMLRKKYIGEEIHDTILRKLFKMLHAGHLFCCFFFFSIGRGFLSCLNQIVQIMHYWVLPSLSFLTLVQKTCEMFILSSCWFYVFIVLHANSLILNKNKE